MKNNRVALITGAAGLLGRQHAMALLELNFEVILVDIDKKKLMNTSNYLKKKFKKKKIKSFKADINPKMKKIKNSIGKFENYSIKNFKKEIEVGIVGAFICTKIFGSEMSKKNFGIIVNMGSDLALIAPDHSIYHPKEKYNELKIFKPAGYSVSKFGLLGLTKYTSTYWAKKNIRCNMLVAGGVKNNQPKYLIKNLKKRIPLNRMAEPDEYKKALQFLCLDDSKYMTGQTLVLDGGRSVW